MYIYTYTHIYIYTYTHTYIYIYAHTHTYIYMYSTVYNTHFFLQILYYISVYYDKLVSPIYTL